MHLDARTNDRKSSLHCDLVLPGTENIHFYYHHYCCCSHPSSLGGPVTIRARKDGAVPLLSRSNNRPRKPKACFSLVTKGTHKRAQRTHRPVRAQILLFLLVPRRHKSGGLLVRLVDSYYYYARGRARSSQHELCEYDRGEEPQSQSLFLFLPLPLYFSFCYNVGFFFGFFFPNDTKLTFA